MGEERGAVPGALSGAGGSVGVVGRRSSVVGRQVSGLRSQVSGLKSQVSSLRSAASGRWPANAKDRGSARGGRLPRSGFPAEFGRSPNSNVTASPLRSVSVGDSVVQTAGHPLIPRGHDEPVELLGSSGFPNPVQIADLSEPGHKCSVGPSCAAPACAMRFAFGHDLVLCPSPGTRSCPLITPVGDVGDYIRERRWD